MLCCAITRNDEGAAACCSVLQRVAVSKDMNVLLRYYKEQQGCCSVLQHVAVSKDMYALLRYYKE